MPSRVSRSPRIPLFEERDPWLDRHELVECGRTGAGNENVALPFVSTINGSVSGINRESLRLSATFDHRPTSIKTALLEIRSSDPERGTSQISKHHFNAGITG